MCGSSRHERQNSGGQRAEREPLTSLTLGRRAAALKHIPPNVVIILIPPTAESSSPIVSQAEHTASSYNKMEQDLQSAWLFRIEKKKRYPLFIFLVGDDEKIEDGS